MNQIAGTIPVVVMGSAQGIPCYEVRIDEAGAMEQAMEYLVREGHRKIAFWGGEENAYSLTEKYYAFLRMLHKYGLESRNEWLEEIYYFRWWVFRKHIKSCLWKSRGSRL